MKGIPNNAKKVFEGVLFDVYQWEQKLFDGSFRTFEKLKRNDSCTVIAVTEEKKILIATDEQPHRGAIEAFLGGNAESHEEPIEAAKRELMEEAGYAASEWELFRSDVPSEKIDWSIYTYIARNCKKVSEPNQEAGERVVVREVDFDEMIDVVTAEGFREVQVTRAVLRMMKDGTLDAFREQLLK